MDIDTIERQIFGGRMGRMKWTAAASPLSRHHRNEHGECIADDPTSDPEIAALVQKAKTAGPGEQRIFTLVDTGQCYISPPLYDSTLTLPRQHDRHFISCRTPSRMLLDVGE
jgi:hypothetical protein